MAIVKMRPLVYVLMVGAMFLFLATTWLGFNGMAGLGRNTLAVILGVLGLMLVMYLTIMVLRSRGSRIRGYPNELRFYHATPSRARPMVEVVKGYRGEFEIIVNPDLGEFRPRLPNQRLDLLPKLPPFTFVEFVARGPSGQARIEVPAQMIEWNFGREFERWESELCSPPPGDEV